LRWLTLARQLAKRLADDSLHRSDCIHQSLTIVFHHRWPRCATDGVVMLKYAKLIFAFENQALCVAQLGNHLQLLGSLQQVVGVPTEILYLRSTRKVTSP